MSSPEFCSGKPPRGELQGPRPPPLKIRKDSHKVKKPPPPRLPVIIYTVSPKVIHTDPGEFKTLVQRLTGSSSSSSAAMDHIEKSNPQELGRKQQSGDHGGFGVEILYPGPSLVEPDPNDGFCRDLSPVFGSNAQFTEDDDSFMQSPSACLSPHLNSPTPPMDLFNNILDFN